MEVVRARGAEMAQDLVAGYECFEHLCAGGCRRLARCKSGWRHHCGGVDGAALVGVVEV